MRVYIGTKVIKAQPMIRGDYNTHRGWTLPADEDGSDEGYIVEYKDGYVSWSPKAQFEEAYVEAESGVPFGQAIELVKRGYKMARQGWNGKRMFIYLPSNPLGQYDPAIVMRTAQGTHQIGWLASQADMLANDWVIVEEVRGEL